MENPEGINLSSPDKELQGLPSVLICDAKNIYDAVTHVETSGLQLEEKRTAVECLAIRNRTKHAGVKLRWVDSDQELADGLTKMHAYDQLLRALQLNKWSIVFDERFVSAKRKRQNRVKTT